MFAKSTRCAELRCTNLAGPVVFRGRHRPNTADTRPDAARLRRRAVALVAFPRGVVLGIVRAGHVDNARAGLIRPRTRADLRPRAPEAVAASQQTRCNLSDHDSDYRSEHQSERERGCTYAVVFDIGKSLSSDPETSLHCVFNFIPRSKKARRSYSKNCYLDLARFLAHESHLKKVSSA